MCRNTKHQELWKKRSKGEIAKVILTYLLMTGAFVTILAMPNLAQLLKYVDIDDGKIKFKIRRSANTLQRRGLIKIEQRGGEVYASLTKKGLREARLSNLKFGGSDKGRVWDKKWRIIMFDIPERKVGARRALNKILKDMNCYSYQKSVFVTPFECKKEIDFLGDCFEARNYISMITATEIENESKVRKHFKL